MSRILRVSALVVGSLLPFPRAVAQNAKNPPQANPPAALPAGITVSDPIYPIPLEDRDPMRDLQLQWDEMELDNQKKLVEIEKNHQKQQQLMDQLKVLAIKFAQKKQINLDVYDLDPKDLKFAKRK